MKHEHDDDNAVEEDGSIEGDDNAVEEEDLDDDDDDDSVKEEDRDEEGNLSEEAWLIMHEVEAEDCKSQGDPHEVEPPSFNNLRPHWHEHRIKNDPEGVKTIRAIKMAILSAGEEALNAFCDIWKYDKFLFFERPGGLRNCGMSRQPRQIDHLYLTVP